MLAVINYINANGSGSILGSHTSAPPYPDVDGDDQVVAQDVLDIINYISAHPGQSEADASVAQAIPAPFNMPAELINLLAADAASAILNRRR